MWCNSTGTHSLCRRKKNYTRRLAIYVYQLLNSMTIQDVATNLNMQWKTIKDIEKKKLKIKYRTHNYRGVRNIAIDEFAIKRGHIYQTVVLDLDTKRVLYIGEGRSANCLDVFWKRIKRQKVEIKAIAVDMWPAYLKSVMDNSPESIIVYDRFHIFKMMNNTMGEIRKLLFKEETLVENKKLIKGTRWLLLSREYNLSNSGRERLQKALLINEPLSKTYYLKEKLSLLWEQSNKEEAENFLTAWCEEAEITNIQPLLKFVNTLKAHRSGIINWYETKISTGPLEGINNKIKVLKRKAYGYRDIDFFNLKIMDMHTTRYA